MYVCVSECNCVSVSIHHMCVSEYLRVCTAAYLFMEVLFFSVIFCANVCFFLHVFCMCDFFVCIFVSKGDSGIVCVGMRKSI